MSTPVTAVRSRVHRFPSPTPEADGTFAWDITTAVTVEVDAGGRTGLGWTYRSPAAASPVHGELAGVVCDRDVLGVAPADLFGRVRDDDAPAVTDGALRVPDGPGHGMSPSSGAERRRAA